MTEKFPLIGARRGSLEVLRDLLRCDGDFITVAKGKVRMSQHLLYTYLAYLEGVGAVRVERPSDHRVVIRITPKGQAILSKIEELCAILQSPSLNGR